MKKPATFQLEYEDAEKIARFERIYGDRWRICTLPDSAIKIEEAFDDYATSERLACERSFELGVDVDVVAIRNLRGQTHHGIDVWDWDYSERVSRIVNGRVFCLFHGGDWYI